MAEETNEIGVATGLAWTEVGGEILVTEATLMPGKGKLTLTGKLGDVMQESAQAAMSYVRSKAEEFGIPKDFNRKTDVHIHVPEGAIPKDGPSAGITLATALVSALARVPIRKDVAMTGEITLRGKVLPIGGVKEKVLAAHRAGIKNIILPKDNEKDLADIPKNVLDTLNVYMVQTMDEVLKIALAEPLAGRLPAAPAEPVDTSSTTRSPTDGRRFRIGRTRIESTALEPIRRPPANPLKIDAEFVTSAASAGDFPRDGLPEVALVGRSNVGKSSLINALVRQRAGAHERGARQDAAGERLPGRSAAASARRSTWSDLPGYGYARGGDASAASSTSCDARHAPQAGDGGAARPRVAALLLVDARHPGLESDRRRLAMAAARGGRRGASSRPRSTSCARGERIRALRATRIRV